MATKNYERELGGINAKLESKVGPAGATIAQWEAVYLASDGTWKLADGNGSGTYPARGLAVAGAASAAAVTVIAGPSFCAT